MKTLPLILSFFLSIQLFGQSNLDVHSHNHDEPAFRPNKGQWGDGFSHLVFLKKYEAYLTSDGLVLGMSPIEALLAYHDALHDNVEPENAPAIPRFSYSIVYDNINTDAVIEEQEASTLYRNYFLGEQSNWVSRVHDFKSVIKKDIYPGIDLAYKVTKRSNLEFDYILEPGADPSLISWSYKGVEPRISDGKISYETPYGLVEEVIPEAYQNINGRKVPVNIDFKQNASTFYFQIAEYDSDYELIIDPVIIASTLTGTVGDNNFGHGGTYDEEGNIFSYGRNFGSGLPTGDGVIQPDYGGGGEDVALNKFNPTGTDQIYATYIGGTGNDLPHSTITNLFGDCFVFGTTTSTDYPVVPGAIQSSNAGGLDIFISRVSADGTEMIGSTYLGGTEMDGRSPVSPGYDQYRGELSLDQEGNIYLASTTTSDDFPTTPGTYSPNLDGESDGVVAKLSAELSAAFWITTVGGDDNDVAYGVRVKDNGNVVISGATIGDSYPTTAEAFQETANSASGQNGFVSILNNSGSQLLSSSFASTSGQDQAFFVDLDNDENIWIYGITNTPGEWPVTEGVFTTESQSMFITQFNPNLSDVTVSTLIGPDVPNGFGFPAPTAFLVDRCDRVYISCFNAPSDMPLTDDALFENGGFYLAAFEESLSLLSFATYYTGNHVDGGTSRFDKKGVVYQGVCSGGGFNTNDDAYATDQATGWDIGVFKIDFELSGVNAALSAPSELDGCVPHTVNFSNFSVGDTFEWDFGDGSPVSNEFEPSHEYTEPGTYTVTLIASDELSCNLADTVSVTIDIFSPTDFTPSFDTEVNCENGEVTLLNTTGGESFLDFTWVINGEELYNSYNATHQFDDLSGSNTVGLLAVDEGCELDELITEDITSLADVTAEIGNTATTNCGLDIELENTSVNGISYLWDFGDGNTSTEVSPTHTYSDFGSYTITLTATNPSTCNEEDQSSIDVSFVEPPELNQSLNLSQFGNCSELNISGTISDLVNIQELTWFIEGDEVGTGADFEAELPSQGTYNVEVEIVPVGCQNTFTLSDQVDLIAELPLDLGPDRSICYDQEGLTLENLTDIGPANYLWSPGGETTSEIFVTNPGTYSVFVTTEACFDEVSINIGLGEEVNPDAEIRICEGVNTLLEVPVAYREFNWDTGASDNTIYVEEAGEFEFNYIDQNGCYQEGTFTVEADPADVNVFVPNAFTPNGDGINDIFKPSVNDLDDYELRVFNRWGEQMFSTTDPSKGWNGSYEGNDYFVPAGVYAYLIKYSGVCSQDKIEKTGSVMIIR